MIAAFQEAKQAQAPKIEFFHNHGSPFSRAVHMTLEAVGVPYEMNELDFFDKKEHKSDWYLKINPKGEVPAIRIGDFCLAERYL